MEDKTFLSSQIAIETSLKDIKRCYDILAMETENKRIMDGRIERILGESFV